MRIPPKQFWIAARAGTRLFVGCISFLECANVTRQQIASRGGKAVVAKYGREHMRELALLWHEKYKLVKYGRNDWLIVNRSTGAANAKTLNGESYSPRQK
jgi:hypothetical protein